MAYADGRTFFDADSHLMELPDFLSGHADPGLRDRIPEISFDSGGKMKVKLEELGRAKAQPPERVEEMIAMGDGLIAGPKGYEALGAFNSRERTTALDQLGFHKQLVFSSFSAGVVFDPRLEPEVLYGSCRAHNRAMAEFCDGDDRLMGVALVPFEDPERAAAEIDFCVEADMGAVWVPHRPAAGRAPGHNDHDPLWARLAEAGIPFVLHVGGVPLQLPPAFMNTGREIPTDWLGGGENVRGKDMVGLHQPAETWISTLVLDGVLDRHPNLRGGVIELGAGWVPAMLRRVDYIAEIWKRSEPELAALTRKPSDQITDQLAFTPYPFEDVGAMIRESNENLYLFSSDYPHIEGGRNPLGRFGTSLAGFDASTLDKFYSGNFASMVPSL